MSVQIVNPWSGEIEYRYDYYDAARIEQRLAASVAGYADWRTRPIDERAGIVHAFAMQLRQRRDALAEVVTAEMGKLTREALGEIDKCADALDYYADHAPAMLDDETIATEARRSLVSYEPTGCVLAVMPWNFPIWQVVRFLAPALMAGNVCLLKHATNVPRCADAIADAARAAGVPAGAFDVLHIDNAQTAAVIADPRIVAVTLTGSERAGRSVASTAGQHLKKCVLELGGSDPLLVLEDADIEQAVKLAVDARYSNAGQTCIAAKRFIVVGGIAERFTDALVETVRGLQPGDPRDPATRLAPLARADLRDTLHDQVQRSVAQGAKVLVGGQPVEGRDCAYPATVLDGVASDSVAFQEELFGPVAALTRARNEDEAVALANDSRFGLGATVISPDIARAEAVARRIDAGCVFVNAKVKSDVRMPFGGTKSSGFGRELAAIGMHEFMNIKSVWVE